MVVEKPELKKIVRIVHYKNRGSGNHNYDCEVPYTCFQQSKEGPGRWKQQSAQGRVR